MPDYKELFYKSQAAIADTIEKLDLLSAQLKVFMQDCEEEAVSEKEKIIMIKFSQSAFLDTSLKTFNLNTNLPTK